MDNIILLFPVDSILHFSVGSIILRLPADSIDNIILVSVVGNIFSLFRGLHQFAMLSPVDKISVGNILLSPRDAFLHYSVSNISLLSSVDIILTLFHG